MKVQGESLHFYNRINGVEMARIIKIADNPQLSFDERIKILSCRAAHDSGFLVLFLLLIFNQRLWRNKITKSKKEVTRV